MDERDSSTLNKDCWHSKYGNFCKFDQAPSQFFGWGLGTRLQLILDCTWLHFGRSFKERAKLHI